MRILPPLFLTAMLLPGLAHAQSVEYRTLELSDGRSLSGTVTESLAEGMMLRLAQGSILVRYDQLVGIEVIERLDEEVWTVALAPITGDLQPDLGAWLAQAASGMPGVRWVQGGLWAESAKPCGGAIDCLAKKAGGLGADYVIGAVYESSEQRLQLKGVHLTQGAIVGEAGVFVPQSQEDAAPVLLGAVFTALGLRPDVDVVSASKGGASSPAPSAEPVAAQPAPESKPVAAQPAPESKPVAVQPTPESKPVAVKPAARPEPTATRLVRDRPRASWSRSRGASVALGFAPIPGLSSAYIGDAPGFVVSLVGTVGLGAASVYALGSTVRWKDPFVASSILVPYAINVIFNQVAGQVGWQRLYGNASVTKARVPVAAGFAPLFADGKRAPTGAALTVGGRF